MTSHSEFEELDELHMGNGGTQRRPDPSYLTIRLRCLQIQKSWSKEDRVRRLDCDIEHGKPRGKSRT